MCMDVFDVLVWLFICFVFKDTATTEIYTYLHTRSRHDALPISEQKRRGGHGSWPCRRDPARVHRRGGDGAQARGNPCRGMERPVGRSVSPDRKSTRLNSSH